MLRFDVVSANKKILDSSLKNGLISRASDKGLVDVQVHDLRDYASGRYKQIDDTPYGGGSGMILKPEPIFKCVKQLLKKRNYDEVIFLSPQGKILEQADANYYSLKSSFILICGHYKGIDERVIKRFVTKEISVGKYVLSCGDIAALVFIDSVSRLIPGVLGDGESAITDTYQVQTGFDFPQYTRPRIYDNLKVPQVLLSGDHIKIENWRKKKALEKFKKSKKINYKNDK